MMPRLLRPGGDKLYRRCSAKTKTVETSVTSTSVTSTSAGSSTTTAGSAVLVHRISKNFIRGRCTTSFPSSSSSATATAINATSIGSLDKLCNHSIPNVEERHTRLGHQHLHRPLPTNHCDDFSNNLVPLYYSQKYYHSHHLSISNSYNVLDTRIGKNNVRWFTSSSDNNDKNQAKKAIQQEEEQVSLQEKEQTQSSKAASAIRLSSESKGEEKGEVVTDTAQSESSTSRSSAIQDLVRRSVGPTLERVSNVEVNVGDLLSVYGIITLIAVIIAAPVAVRQMRRSDSTYEDLDPEDPVADLAKLVREEYRNYLLGTGDEGGNGASSRLGGLDTLVADLLESPVIQQAITNLVVQVLQSPHFKQACQVLLSELWTDLVNDPETLQQVIHLLQHAIQDDKIKDAAVELVIEVFSDKEILDELVELVQRLGEEKKVQDATRSLLVESAHNALNDPEILDHSMEFATDVVGDDVVQQTAGEALYNTLSYAVRPTLSVLLSTLGVGLIVLSIAALRNVGSSHGTDGAIDRALLLQTLDASAKGDGQGEGVAATVSSILQGLLSIPVHAFVAGRDAIMWVLLFPVRLVTGSLSRLGRVGKTTADMITNGGQWLWHLPVRLVNTIVGAIGFGLSTMFGSIQQQGQMLAMTISNSFFGTFFRNFVSALNTSTVATRNFFIACYNISAHGMDSANQLYQSLVEILSTVMSRTLTGMTTSKVAAADSMSLTIQKISKGYDYLNHLAASLAFFIERMLLSIQTTIIRKK